MGFLFPPDACFHCPAVWNAQLPEPAVDMQGVQVVAEEKVGLLSGLLQHDL